MKKRRAILFLVGLCMVCIFAGLLTACGGGSTDYTSGSAPNSNGNSGVEVIYELEGGTYQNTTRHVRMYYYVPEGGETLIAPPGEYSKRDIICANYEISGWYKTRTENADGTVSYSDEWNFETDKVKSGDESLTLYCGWRPKVKHTYEICYFDENGEEQVFTSIETQQGMPFGDSSNRADNRPGYTAKRAPNANGVYEIVYYEGKDGSGNWIPWDPSFTHPGGETSTAVKVYVDYLEGDFVYVSTADEFIAAAKNYSRNREGVYLTQSIDLEGKETEGFRDGAGKFTSVFYGNGFSVTGITLTFDANDYVSNQQALLGDRALCIALFGNMEGATVENVTFEFDLEVDVKYSRINYVYIAPLAVLAQDSNVKDVTVNGSVTVKQVDTKNDTFECEHKRLFWQEGVTGENCEAHVTFTDETQAG